VTAPIVTTTSGEVRGELVDGVARFLSIPYAAAPVGDLRFAPPAPAPAWDGVRDATQPGPTAPQIHRAFPGLDLAPIVGFGWKQGPEYLTADVISPDPDATGLPVLVFIHGGAFSGGTGSAPVYDGVGFAHEGTVLVRINYRLGIEGFVPLDGGATNIGLRDQIAALEWVRDNAAAFGGDPAKVTVFGESAGAMSIGCLLASPLADGLFRRAIVESGHAEMVRPPAQARVLAERLASLLGVPATAEAFRALPSEKLLEAQSALMVPANMPDLRDSDGFDPSYGLSPFLPVFGDDVLPEHPAEAIARGAGADVDLIVGTCREESALYYVPTGVADAISDEKAVAVVSASHPDAASILKTYGLGEQPAGDVLIAATTDLIFRLGARRLASSHGGRTYCYQFDWGSPRFDGRLGACHGLELPFVFNTLDVAADLVGPDAPHEVASLMHRSWVRFAATGDPGWPEYADEKLVRHFDVVSAVRAG
jgi:para-nitrobenzyl esterase